MEDLPQLHKANKKTDEICFVCKQSLDESEFHSYLFNDEYRKIHIKCWRVYVKQNKPNTYPVRCPTCGVIIEIDDSGLMWSSYSMVYNKCGVCGGHFERIV